MSDSPLEGYGIVYFGNDWFAENRTSSHHVARRLARDVPVLYVDSPGLRAPSASGRDLRRLGRKLANAVRLPRNVEGQVWHVTVPQIPYRQLPGVEWVNRRFGLWAVRRAIRYAGIGKRIAWFVAPHPGFMAGKLGEDLCVYYVTDDHSTHPGVDAARVRAIDAALTAKADLLFVAPPALVAAKQQANAHAVFAPHGVDAELFGRAMDPATEVPPAARDLPGPVIGYFGSIADWIDVELIAWLATVRPQWSFLLVGHPFTDVTALRPLPNVTLAGAQKYETLPAWAKAFDVAIIPYRLNEQVRNANPLKLREYLATGRPIVTVSNPEIEKFRHLVTICTGRDEFLAGIERALEEPAEARQPRLDAVRPMTWDARVADVVATVAAALERKR